MRPDIWPHSSPENSPSDARRLIAETTSWIHNERTFDRVRKQAIKGCKIPQQLHIKTQTHAKPTKEMLLLFSHTDVGTPWEAERPHGSENVDLWAMKRWRKWKGTQENKSS